jgi:hypothetical protein
MVETKKMTVKQFSEHRKISRQRVYKMIRAGQLLDAVTNQDGKLKIDPVQADRALIGTLDQKFNPPKGLREIEGRDLSESRRLIACYQAALLKLQYQSQVDKWIPAEYVENQTRLFSKLVRKKIMAMPEKLAGEIATMTDHHQVRELLITRFNAALHELSEGA